MKVTQENTKDGKAIVITEVTQKTARFWIVGTTPIILNALSDEAKKELLYPGGPKSKAEKASKPKHDPIAEFRASIHQIKDGKAPTLIAIPAVAPKLAMAAAAMDVGNSSKSQIGRLTYVVGDLIGVYGLPKIFMKWVRPNNAAPDIRTRCIIEFWAAMVEIRFLSPPLKEQAVASLFTAGGFINGVGDWRSQKGKGNYGSFEMMVDKPETRKQIAHILKFGRREQIAAMKAAAPYDDETSELLSWFMAEAKARGDKITDDI